MTVPIQTFTGESGKGLGGTNGAGTKITGGLQRDVSTLFAMMNPEATRPDGQPGGIQRENLASNIWDGFLGDNISTESDPGLVKTPAEFISNGLLQFGKLLKLHADSGWQLNTAANSNIVWSTSNGSAIYTFTFATPFPSLSYPYIAHVFLADDPYNTNLRGTYACAPSNMTLTGCKLQTGTRVARENGDGNTYYYWETIGTYFRLLLFRIV